MQKLARKVAIDNSEYYRNFLKVRIATREIKRILILQNKKWKFTFKIAYNPKIVKSQRQRDIYEIY